MRSSKPVEPSPGANTLSGRVVAEYARVSSREAYYNWQARKHRCHEETFVPRGFEPLKLRLLAVHSNQLSDETIEVAKALLYDCVVLLTELRLRQVPCAARISISREAPIQVSHAPAQLHCVAVWSLNISVWYAAELRWIERTSNLPLHQTAALHINASEGSES